MAYNFADDRIAFIEALRERMQEVGSFSKCWDANALRGMNPRSGNTYQGGNRMRIADDIVRNKYNDHRYMTFKQIQDAGYKLKKGAKGVRLEKWGIRDTTKEVKDENGNTEIVMNGKNHMFCSAFTVFNGDMIEGLPPREVHILEKNLYDIVATDIQNSSECPVYNLPHQGEAYYSPSKDEIVLPPRETFKDAESYLSVLIHEAAHSTGHESRLNRSFGNEFGSKEYAKEELRAQMASMFVQSTLGLEINPDHYDNSAAYLKSWDSLFKEEPNEFFKAAADAEKICERVVEKYNEYIKEKELEAENTLDNGISNDEFEKIKAENTAAILSGDVKQEIEAVQIESSKEIPYDSKLRSHIQTNKTENGVIIGTSKFYHENGNLASETTIINGQLNGIYRQYSFEGSLSSEGQYKDGKLDGYNYTYYEDGKREKYEEFFVDGVVKERTAFNHNGEIESVVNFNEDHIKTINYNAGEISSEQLQFERKSDDIFEKKYEIGNISVDIIKNQDGTLHLNFTKENEMYEKDFNNYSDLKEELKKELNEKDFEMIKSSLNLDEGALSNKNPSLISARLYEIKRTDHFNYHLPKGGEYYSSEKNNTKDVFSIIEKAKEVSKSLTQYKLIIESPKYNKKTDNISLELNVGRGVYPFDENKSITENIKTQLNISLENQIMAAVESGNGQKALAVLKKQEATIEKFIKALEKEEKALAKEPVEKVKVEKETYYTIETEEKILFHGTQKDFEDLIDNVRWEALKDKNNLPYQELEFAAKEGATPLTIEKYGDLEQFYEQAFYRENPNCLPVEINKTNTKDIYKDLSLEFNWSESSKISEYPEKHGNILKGKEAYSMIKLVMKEDREKNERRDQEKYKGKESRYDKTSFKYIKIKDFRMNDVRIDVGDLEFGGKKTVSNGLQHRFEAVLKGSEELSKMYSEKKPEEHTKNVADIAIARVQLAEGIKAIKKSEKSLEKSNDRGR